MVVWYYTALPDQVDAYTAVSPLLPVCIHQSSEAATPPSEGTNLPTWSVLPVFSFFL